MRSLEVRAKAIALADKGMSDREVGERLDLPRATVHYMRVAGARARWRCPRCWRTGKTIELSAADYAELLGLYLGDGCISRAGRTARLRLALDAGYPGIISETQALLRRGFPQSSVGEVHADRGSTVMVSVYSSHLACLFPQHGPGKKHERQIVLEGWQKRILEREAWAFLAGCIRSDGCAFINRTGPYKYLTYDFRNRSADIRGLFTSACDSVGLEYRAHSDRVRVNRRKSVEALLRQIGLKS